MLLVAKREARTWYRSSSLTAAASLVLNDWSRRKALSLGAMICGGGADALVSRVDHHAAPTPRDGGGQRARGNEP